MLDRHDDTTTFFRRDGKDLERAVVRDDDALLLGRGFGTRDLLVFVAHGGRFCPVRGVVSPRSPDRVVDDTLDA